MFSETHKGVNLFPSPLPADGVALGAAASTSQTSVQLIVFVAIMLHKVRADRKTLVTLQTVLFLRGFEPVTSAGSRRLRPGFLPDARRPGEEPNPQTPAGFRAGRPRPRHADVFGPQPGTDGQEAAVSRKLGL